VLLCCSLWELPIALSVRVRDASTLARLKSELATTGSSWVKLGEGITRTSTGCDRRLISSQLKQQQHARYTSHKSRSPTRPSCVLHRSSRLARVHPRRQTLMGASHPIHQLESLVLTESLLSAACAGRGPAQRTIADTDT
jgi:hypothetical protein